MIRTITLIVSSVLAFSMTPRTSASELDKQSSSYVDEYKYAIVVGRISRHKLIEIEDEGNSINSHYYVDVDVNRKIQGEEFNLKNFSTDMNISDISYTEGKNIIFVLEKTASWRVVFWSHVNEIICLNEDELQENGWLKIAIDRITDNCIII